MGFPRQEDWSGWSCPPPGDLPDPGLGPECLMSLALAGGLFLVPVNVKVITVGKALSRCKGEFSNEVPKLYMVKILNFWITLPQKMGRKRAV